MLTDEQVNKARTTSQNWSLLSDFNHAAKSIVKPVIYEEVQLTNAERANRLLKQFGRFASNLDDPQLYIASHEWLISALNIVDIYARNNSTEYTMNHVKNDILKEIVKTTALKIVV